MIQSRPTKQALGDYMFFIEFKEDANTLPVQTALNCLRLKLREAPGEMKRDFGLERFDGEILETEVQRRGS